MLLYITVRVSRHCDDIICKLWHLDHCDAIRVVLRIMSIFIYFYIMRTENPAI